MIGSRDIAYKLTQKFDYRASDLKAILKEVFVIIQENVDKGEIVSIANFGSFTNKMKRGRTTTNPLTGEVHETRSSKTIDFKPAKNTLK